MLRLPLIAPFPSADWATGLLENSAPSSNPNASLIVYLPPATENHPTEASLMWSPRRWVVHRLTDEGLVNGAGRRRFTSEQP